MSRGLNKINFFKGSGAIMQANAQGTFYIFVLEFYENIAQRIYYTGRGKHLEFVKGESKGRSWGMRAKDRWWGLFEVKLFTG